jgi:hypothetical protein
MYRERAHPEVLAMRERDQLVVAAQAVERRRLDGLVGHALEHRLGTDPPFAPRADHLGQVVRGGLGVADHAAELPVARQAPRVIAVGVGQEDVIDRQRRQRAFAHVEADPELGNLDVGREARDREPCERDVTELERDLVERVEVHANLGRETAARSTQRFAGGGGANRSSS